jgi:hypothetical protein
MIKNITGRNETADSCNSTNRKTMQCFSSFLIILGAVAGGRIRHRSAPDEPHSGEE